jgi:hypothetical protein
MIQHAKRQTGERSDPATDFRLSAMLKRDAAAGSPPSADLRDRILRQTVGSNNVRRVKPAATSPRIAGRWPIGRLPLALAAGLALAALLAAAVVWNRIGSPTAKPPVPVVKQPAVPPAPPVASADFALVAPAAMLDAPGELVTDLTGRLARRQMAGLVQHARMRGEDWLNALPLPAEFIADQGAGQRQSP